MECEYLALTGFTSLLSFSICLHYSVSVSLINSITHSNQSVSQSFLNDRLKKEEFTS